MKEEKILGHRREESESKSTNLGKYVSIVLATMCTRLGSYDWSELKESGTADREIVLSQMWMPDVFYAYCWLRYQAMGPNVPMTLRSPFTGDEFPFTADLRSLEVEIPDSLDACLWKYRLKHPLVIRGKTVTEFTLGPQRWSTIEQMSDVSTGAAKATVISASIRAMDGILDKDGKPVDVPLVDSELDEMTKLDLETLADEINRRTVGPIMKITATCPKKKKTFDATIDWRYDHFFGAGSR